MNKTEVIKHVTIRNNKTLKDDQLSLANNNQKLTVNDTSNAKHPMNDSYYNNSTESITSSNHCTGLLIRGDEYVSVETTLLDSTRDSYIRDMNNNRTNNKNNNNINDITELNKNNDHHLEEKDQMKTKKLVANKKKKVFVLGSFRFVLVKHIQGLDITKKLEKNIKFISDSLI